MPALEKKSPTEGRPNPAKGVPQGTGARTKRRSNRKKKLPEALGSKEQNALFCGLPLTNGRRRFVEEYIIDEDTLQAAARAGFTNPEYGRGLLTDPAVSQAILIAKQRRIERTNITADKTLRELAMIAYSDPGDVIDPETNQLLPIKDMPEASRRAIASITVKKRTDRSTGTVIDEEVQTVKFWDKTASLTRLGQAQGLAVGKDGALVQINIGAVNNNSAPAGSLILTPDLVQSMPPALLDAVQQYLQSRQPPPTPAQRYLPPPAQGHAPVTVDSVAPSPESGRPASPDERQDAPAPAPAFEEAEYTPTPPDSPPVIHLSADPGDREEAPSAPDYPSQQPPRMLAELDREDLP